MDDILNSLASADPIRVWLWGGFAVIATLYVLNKGLIFYLTRKMRGLRSWKPRRPPIWLTDWRRPKRPPHPGGLLTREQYSTIFDRYHRIRLLASVRPGKPEDPEVLRILEELLNNFGMRDETQPALEWALAGNYRRALKYVLRLARWSETHFQGPYSLYSEAGALAYCISDAEAVGHFETARSFLPKEKSALIVLNQLYSVAGQWSRVRSVNRDLITALEHERASLQKALDDKRITGRDASETAADIRGLGVRIDQTRLYLESIASK